MMPGRGVGAAGVVAYCASKGAVHQITRAMALDYANYGMPVTAIVRLADLIDFIRQRGDTPQHLENIEAYRREYGV